MKNVRMFLRVARTEVVYNREQKITKKRAAKETQKLLPELVA